MNNQNSFDISLFRDVLRINTEPCEYYTEEQVHQLLMADPAGYFAYVKQVINDIAHGRAELDLTPKQIFTDAECEGDFRVMPCVIRRNGTTTKTVKLVGTNIQQTIVPDQITVGKAFALHPTENFVSHIFEACLLSSARTGICASLAINLLVESARKVAIIGAGRVGYYAALYTCASSSVEQITVHDINHARACATANHLSQEISGINISAPGSPQPDNADVIILATTSREPLLSPAESTASLVISLGADTDDQHELNPAWITQADIFVDTLDSARYGDLKQWQNEGLITSGDMTDLFSLLRATKVTSNHQRRVFISTGSAIFDNLTIAYMLSKSGQLK